MLDILFVSPDLHRGGVGRCVSFVVDAPTADGATVGLFLARGRDDAYPVRNPRVVQALGVIESSIGLLARLPYVAWRLYRTVKREQPKVVCTHGLLCNAMIIPIKWLLGNRFRTVAFEHNSPSTHYATTRFGGLKRALLSYCYRRHDRIVGVSQGVTRDLESMFPALRGRCHHIYNGISLELVRQMVQVAAAMPVSPTFRIVALGRLVEAKDYPTLISAVAILNDPEVVVDIIGDGPDRALLEAQIAREPSQTKINFLGHLDNPFPNLESADLFVLPSKRESFGNVLVEALALGKPIVAADCPSGPGEILDRGRYGVLVPVSDPAAMAAAFRRLIDDAPARAKLAAGGPQRAADFSLESHCVAVFDLFRPLMKPSS
jgi:glycosyltransferase involved in cell wall biosynthesis